MTMSGNLDFDLGARVNKAKDARLRRQKQLQRRKLAEAKKTQQALDVVNSFRSKAEAELRETERLRREAEAEERRKKLEEFERTGGVSFVQNLEAYPIATADTNRVVLPASAIEKLIAEKALDSNHQGPLIFELSVFGKDGKLLERTHAGVDEFTAEEGKIGIPPKTALCLTKSRGLNWLSEHPQVQVKYVVLKSYSQTFMRVQPRGDGFHSSETEDSVSIDIKTVLENSLRQHFVISEGDWVPIVHENKSYELIVQSLEPESAIEILNTDLEVDIMPSENSEAAMKAKEAEANLEQEFASLMKKKHEEKLLLLSKHAEPKPGKGVVTFRVRLPNAKVISRRFLVTNELRLVLDWIDVELSSFPVESFKAIPPFSKYEYFFDLVESWPGHKRVLDGNKDFDKPLKGLGFIKSGHSLTAVWKRESSSTEEIETTSSNQSGSVDVTEESMNDQWHIAAQKLRNKIQDDYVKDSESMEIDEAPSGDEQKTFSKDEILSIFNTLVEAGAEKSQALEVAQKYPGEVKELENMGFGYCLDRAVPYMIKYNGRLLRVTNAIFNEDEESQQIRHSPPSDNDSVPAASDKQRNQELFQLKLAELLSMGVDPKEAALQALQHLKSE